MRQQKGRRCRNDVHLYDYASMAAETVMEDYNHDYAYYTDELAQKRLYNQMIENDFTDALKNKERLV